MISWLKATPQRTNILADKVAHSAMTTTQVPWFIVHFFSTVNPNREPIPYLFRFCNAVLDDRERPVHLHALMVSGRG